MSRGRARDRRKTSEEKATEMYWQGPQYGFANRHEMLQKEFDRRCAYSAKSGGVP